MRGRTNRTEENAQTFLKELSETGNVTAACILVGISRRSAYDWRAEDAEFAARWDQALDQGLDALEAEARRRAFEGVDEPVFYKGQVCGYVRKYSDTLIMFLLKAYRHQFRDRVQVDVNELDRRFEAEMERITAGGERAVSPGTEGETIN